MDHLSLILPFTPQVINLHHLSRRKEDVDDASMKADKLQFDLTFSAISRLLFLF